MYIYYVIFCYTCVSYKWLEYQFTFLDSMYFKGILPHVCLDSGQLRSLGTLLHFLIFDENVNYGPHTVHTVIMDTEYHASFSCTLRRMDTYILPCFINISVL